jgi:HNH endonuclease
VAEALVEMVRAVRAALIAFQPEDYSGEECAVLVEDLATLEKVGVAARVRAAGRAGETGAHRERGYADVSDWLARASGSSTSAAKAALDTAAALEQQPEVKAALEAGDLSLAQARELIKTEAACPGAAAELLDVAREQSLKSLKEQARDRRVRAIDPEELHRRQHEAQTWRHWRTSLGMVAFAGQLPPEFGIPIANRLDAETDRLWRQAKQNANPELIEAANNAAGQAKPNRAALAAQAFVRLVETGGKGKARAADLVIVCDLEAYRRGHTLDGEACHIIGGGPIPVSVAQGLGRDAFLKAVLHNGTELHTIAHFGRKTSAVLRTALTLGAPPLFDGIKCSMPGCDRHYYLEQDHIDPVANGGPTSVENMRPLCWHHHLIKTEQDRKAGRLRHQQYRQVKRAKRRKGPSTDGPDPP